MATHFERQLEELHVQIITMGSLCEKVISLSNRAIRGDDCVWEIFDTDREIDTKEREIENHCKMCIRDSSECPVDSSRDFVSREHWQYSRKFF